MLVSIEGVNGTGKDTLINIIRELRPEYELLSSKVSDKNIINDLSYLDSVGLDRVIEITNKFIDKIKDSSSNINKDKVTILNRWTLSNYVHTLVVKILFYKDIEHKHYPDIYLKKVYEDIEIPDLCVYVKPNPELEKRLVKRNKYTTTYEKDNVRDKLIELYDVNRTDKFAKEYMVVSNSGGVEDLKKEAERIIEYIEERL